MNAPDEITHYYSAADKPFRSLSDLAPDDLAKVLTQLKDRKAANPEYKRVFGGRYMDLRRKTEAKLRQLFEGRGGRPERETPHYFTLGPCPWFAGVYPDPRSITLNWRNLPDSVVSVTYPDSFIAMGFGPEFGLPEEPDRACHGQVFLLSEIDGLVSQFGLPDGRADDVYAGYETRSFEKYIEVQLWSDTPVRQFLRR